MSDALVEAVIVREAAVVPESTRAAPRRPAGSSVVKERSAVSGCAAGWWAGVAHRAVGESDGEFAVWSEFDGPSVVVDLGVVVSADRQQVVEVGVAAVSPPGDVVEFAAVVSCLLYTSPSPRDGLLSRMPS